jgi:hypothetical protein
MRRLKSLKSIRYRCRLSSLVEAVQADDRTLAAHFRLKSV